MPLRQIRWLRELPREVRVSLRSLRRSAGLTTAVVVTLALCIGANTTIFSVLYGLILKPLPFHDSSQLVEVYASLPKNNEPKRRLSVAQYLHYRENADRFEGFALWAVWTFNIGEETDAERGIGCRVTADYFRISGVQPLVGRFFTLEESTPGKDAVLVLTESYWENKYARDPSVIGRVIRLSERPFTIIGVAPRALEALNADTTIMKPFEWRPDQVAPERRLLALDATLYARVKPGVSHGEARAQLATLHQRHIEQFASPQQREYLDRTGYRIELGQVRAEQTKTVRTALLLLQGGAAFVLLLGCVNVAGLMLARANARQGELAVRQALGAGPLVLVRQLFVEGMLLSSCGSVLGLLLCWGSLRLINTYTTSIVRQVQPVSIDGTMLATALGIAVLVAVLISLLPALKLWKANLLGSLQGGTRGASAGARLRRMSGGLIIVQVALSLVLLVGAALLLRSFGQVLAIEPGFAARTVIQGRIASSVPTPEAATQFLERYLARLREIPGVENVAATGSFAVFGSFGITSMPMRGAASGDEGAFPHGYVIVASPDYFDVMGIRLLEGRTFTAADTRPGARRVFIVDEDFARKYFPGRSPLGETVDLQRSDLPPEQWPMIVGVVGRARLTGLEDRSGVPFVFVPLGPAPAFSVLVKTTRPSSQVIPEMRAKLRSIDPSLPLYNVGLLQEALDGMLANRRGILFLLGAFAGIALLLSAVGIYGMLAYDVTQRTREIGIRSAIGATRGQIVGMIFRRGLTTALFGVAIGLLGALTLGRFLSSLLFEVQPWDPIAIAGVVVLLVVIASLASWLPARRAARVDPLVALRSE